MRTVIQRVKKASVSVDGKAVSTIGQGLLLLLGIEATDAEEDIQWLCHKVLGLRIFDDEEGVMNRSMLDVNGEALVVMDIDGEIIVVSQFTLMASYKKGNRPSWIRAAGHEHAVPVYERFLEVLSEGLGKQVGKGVFGAEMQVELINDGPVTICMDTKNKE